MRNIFFPYSFPIRIKMKSGVCSFCWNFSECQILWSLCSVDFHTFTLQLLILILHSVVPELQVFVSSLENCQNFSKTSTPLRNININIYTTFFLKFLDFIKCFHKLNISEGNDCYADPCVHGTCTDGDNTYTCSCNSGYKGANCSG